ncbi:ribosome small subunit-dependent GTPase A [Microbulbifer zhoushanensis]|uniref:ribosome small subunit-dependent GTPase A n=1 Tax=Microbulbifer zhoushanensis TaxID=2904254 RepID=UPI001F013B2E|nr:ribosome small subunit-dependent GTPase A [Microbulbifer zhoushanensis]
MSKSLISRRPPIRRGGADNGRATAPSLSPLQLLGWKPFFQQQLALEELEACDPLRVMAVHRDRLLLAGEQGEEVLALGGTFFNEPASGDTGGQRVTVGDWLLLDRESRRAQRCLERQSLFQRMAPGGQRTQLIAANVDTAVVVSSCNHDFNLSRIERYLALVRATGARPVVVLTKADQCDAPGDYLDRLRELPDIQALALNATDPDSVEPLRGWCGVGETVALLGSSGVGKSTLLNTLSGEQQAAIAAIREDDSKGRHTTRHRELYPLPGGALLLDSPGMRELGLAGVERGLEEAFGDIGVLASQCRFADCRHQSEPGCAVIAALDSGELDERRLHNWRKLEREVARNNRTLAEQRAGDKALGQMYRAVQGHARNRKQRGD